MALRSAHRVGPAWRLLRDTRGAIAIQAVGGMIVAIGIAALVIDLGLAYLRHRELQGATDLAALAAATVLDRPAEAARLTLADNSFPDAVLRAVARGRYEANPRVAPQARFVADATPTNAVRLQVETTVPSFFAKVVSSTDGITVGVESTAATKRLAAFSIGSRLAGLREGAINGLLGAMLGANVSLSLMSYEALAQAKIDLFNYLDALAWHLSLTGASYERVLEAEVSVGTLVDLMVSEVSAGSGASSTALLALQHLQNQLLDGGPDVRLGRAIMLGPVSDRPSGSGGSGAEAHLSAFDLLRTAAMIASLERQVEVELDLEVPYTASAEARLVIGEPMQGSGWIAVGDEGTSVHTAQTRLHVQVEATRDLAGLGLADVRLPMYVEAARGDGTLESIRCASDGSARGVTVQARGGVVEAWIGEFPSNWLLAGGQMMPDPQPAVLVRTALLDVSGAADAALAAPEGTALYFSEADIEHGRVRSTESYAMVGTLAQILVANTSLRVSENVLGTTLTDHDTRAIARDALTAAAAAVDPLVDTLLATLGVHVGEVDVVVNGADCRGAVLVN